MCGELNSCQLHRNNLSPPSLSSSSLLDTRTVFSSCKCVSTVDKQNGICQNHQPTTIFFLEQRYTFNEHYKVAFRGICKLRLAYVNLGEKTAAKKASDQMMWKCLTRQFGTPFRSCHIYLFYTIDCFKTNSFTET